MRENLAVAKVLRRWLSTRTERDAGTKCDVWQRSVTSGGYARVMAPWGGTIAVHRLVYIVLVGPIRDGFEVHHRCANRRCCNPAHLLAVDDMNHKRLDANSMVSRTHCKRGHPLSGDNLSPARLKAGKRICRVCASLRFQKFRDRDLEDYRKYQREYQKARRERSKPIQQIPT